VRHFTPPFTLKYIESLLFKAKYHTILFDCLTANARWEAVLIDIIKWKPDIIIILSSIHGKTMALELSSFLKKKSDVFTVAIGAGPTHNPNEYIFVNSPVDVIIKGEPEIEVAYLIDQLNKDVGRENIRRIYRERITKNEILVDNLNSLPFPKYNYNEIIAYRFLYPIRIAKKLKWGHILSSRGCWHKCSFCSQVIRESYGKSVRFRSAVNVVNEIEYLMIMGVNIVAFDDDDFTLSIKHVEGICLEIIERGLNIKWIAHSRVDEVKFSLMKLMKEAGCVLLKFGIESGSQRIIDILDKNTYNLDWIKTSYNAFHYARKIDIATCALFIIGNPTETEQEVKNTIKLARKLKPDFIQIHFFTIYPGSIIYERFKNELTVDKLSAMYHYCLPELNVSSIQAIKLLKIRAYFYKKLFLNPSFIIEHFLKYILFYLCNINVASLLSQRFKFQKCSRRAKA